MNNKHIKNFILILFIKRAAVFRIIFFILLLSSLKGQNRPVDSLKFALKGATEDTVYINLCIDLSNQYMLFNYDSALIYLELGEVRGKKINKPFWLGQTTRRRGIIYDRAGNFDEAEKLYKEAIFYANKAIADAQTPKEEYRGKRLLAACNSDLGSVAIGKSNYIEGIDFFNKAIKINTELKNKRGLSVNLGNRGIIYYKIANYPEAMKNYFAALKINDELKDTENQSINYVNIGLVYKDTRNYALAIEYFQKALGLYIKLGDKINISYALGNLGIVNLDLKRYDVAEQFIRQALSIDRSIDDQYGVTRHLGNLGLIAVNTGKREEAEKYYDSAIIISRKFSYWDNLARQLQYLADLQSAEKKYAVAEKNYLESLDLGAENKLLSRLMEGHLGLSHIYRKLNKYEKALKHYEQYISYRDSIYNEENTKKNLKEAIKYEYEKKAAADSVKAGEEKKVVQAQLKQEQVQRYSLLAGLLLVVVFSLFMVNRFRVTNKQKKLIEEQKRIVEDQKGLVEEKQKEILDSIQYAKRIQTALMANEVYIERTINRMKK